MDQNSFSKPSLSYLMDRGSRVGTLVRWDPVTRQGSDPLDIYSNEEIFIGRYKRYCQYEVSDPFVSNCHLRIYTILFEEDPASEVAPMVYAEDLSRNGTLLNRYPMGRGNGSFLLTHGDLLHVSPATSIRFNSATYVRDDRFSDIQIQEIELFQDQYLITHRVLGFGAYGKVHMAIQETTGKQLACKITNLKAMSRKADDDGTASSKFFRALQPAKLVEFRRIDMEEEKAKARLERNQSEAKILAKLSHPNIVNIQKVFQSENTIYIMSELLTGGDLFSFIKYKGGRLEELTAAAITLQILLAVQYLHKLNIVHRDIKPDNILMASREDGCRVVLTDFGCAKIVDPQAQRTLTLVGTAEYCAPEVCKSNTRGYTKAVDLWSVGCVTTVLIAGYSPFDEGRQFHQYDLDMLEDELISTGTNEAAIDFIYRLLVLDEFKRMNVKQALHHTWLTGPEHKLKLDKIYQHAIRDWKESSKDESIIVDLKDMKNPSALGRSNEDISMEIEPTQARLLSQVDHISESSYDMTYVENQSPDLSLTLSCTSPCEKKVIKGSQFTEFRDQRLMILDPDDVVQKSKEMADESPNKRLKRCANSEPKFAGQDQLLEAQFLEAALKMAEIQVREDINLLSTEKDDEVYEEFHNPFTGKKRRYIYGRDVDSISGTL